MPLSKNKPQMKGRRKKKSGDRAMVTGVKRDKKQTCHEAERQTDGWREERKEWSMEETERREHERTKGRNRIIFSQRRKKISNHPISLILFPPGPICNCSNLNPNNV